MYSLDHNPYHIVALRFWMSVLVILAHLNTADIVVI